MTLLSYRLGAVGAALLLAVLAPGCSGAKAPQPAATAPPVELIVSAAVSLNDALADIEKNYRVNHPNIKLIYNLGGSGALQKQIEQGAPADIFISAAPKQMDELEAKNLIDKATRQNLAENRLVLVVPKDSPLVLVKFEDLTNNNVQKIAMGETATVPAGQYAREVLQNLGLWDKLKDKLILAKDVRTVLTYVETGNVEAGFIYKTDATASAKVKIAVTAPDGSHRPIVYPAAILTGSKQQQAAADFLAYLAGPEGRAVFEKHGFTTGR